jgi:hypothetical protein
VSATVQLDQTQYRAYVRESSPRWLQIIRDVLISLVCLVFLAATVLGISALNRAGNDLTNIGTGSSPAPSASNGPFGDPGDPNDPNNVFNIPGTKEYCSIHPDNPTC